MIHLSTLLKYYKRGDVQNAIVSHAQNKEIAVKYGDRGFGRRPDVLHHPSDVLEFAKNGASSFHCSEELWENPLALDTNMKKNDIETLRTGWDLILDIDCKILDYSKIAADLIVNALKHFGIASVSVKFSGNHGFHIGVPFEAFPENVNGIPTKNLFPDGPRKIAFFLKNMINEHLAERILSFDSIAGIAEKNSKPVSELIKNNRFNPFSILEVDTILIASRHLYRMPYCLNEKSGLVSVPINPSKILAFDKNSAAPDNVFVNEFIFLDRAGVNAGEAGELMMQAFDSDVEELIGKKDVKLNKVQKEFETPKIALAEDYFPPCIKRVLQGLEDGKKRSLFILVNFLTNVGWDYNRIESLINEWNKRNKEQLREVIIKGQLSYHRKANKKILPPNCSSRQYYQDMHLCIPDSLCRKIRNPVNYAIIRARKIQENTSSS